MLGEASSHVNVKNVCMLPLFVLQLQLFSSALVGRVDSLLLPPQVRKCPSRQRSTANFTTSKSTIDGAVIGRVPTEKTKKRSKFAAILPGEASSVPLKYPPVKFSSTTEKDHLTAVLLDDFCPVKQNPLPRHDRRELHYARSLLSLEQVSSILRQCSNDADGFQQNKARCLVAVEDGEPQPNTLTPVLLPMLNEQIVPFARHVCGAPVVVADALVRCYDPAEGNEALDAHYDLTSFASVIIPLNPQECEGGLYVQSGASGETRRSIDFDRAGDALLHRFDVMHGVHVLKGKRYSLVVWLAETEAAMMQKTVPWVERERDESVHAAYLYAMDAKDGLYGVPKDEMAARQYLEFAAEYGHAISQYMLSLLLTKQGSRSEEGRWIEDERERIVKLLKLASNRGLVEAHHSLGTAFKQGYYGLQQDYDVARRYYAHAANHGYQPSIEVLEDASRWA